MTGPRKRRDTKHQARGDRTAVPHRSDPYRARKKWPEPSACPECGAVYHRGRWQWGTAAAGAEMHLCPACERIRDRVPAGELTLSGDFFKMHRDEILHLVRNREAEARAEHPLERIIAVREEPERVTITFTDTHLTHRVGEALRAAYQGKLASHYTDEGDLLRVSWSR
jgi:NMD protein affecting ribosome stability and mRNA decay